MNRLLSLVILLSSLTPLQITSAAARDVFPACQSEKVLKKIAKRFNKTEKIYWEDRGLVLDAVINPHLHNDNAFPESSINRRYCHGDAVFINGKQRRIHFLIEEGAGFAGFTWNVEYCIHGLDPHKYYDGRCRVLSH